MVAPSILAPRLDVSVASVLVLWAALLGVGLIALVGLVALARRSIPASPGGPARTTRRRRSTVECSRLIAEAGERAREAAAVAQRAQAAWGSLIEARARLAHARQAREAAWLAYDEARRRYDELLAAWRAGAAQRAARVHTEEERERQHEVARAALAAYRRGDLSVDELREVFRRTGDWDPLQEQRERDLAVLRAEAQRTHRAYDATAAAERIADKAASVAEVAMRALAEEADQAADGARSAHAAAQECLGALSRRRRRRVLGAAG